MSFPAPQQWLFSVKTFAAAVLALLISLWIALPNPYRALATVYIASNPLSGATRSKAIFRVLGTLIGATAAVVMVPNLAGAPVLLVLAMATWSGHLSLYIPTRPDAEELRVHARGLHCGADRLSDRVFQARFSTWLWRAPRKSSSGFCARP
jgi:Fusaric acid resistance protein family